MIPASTVTHISLEKILYELNGMQSILFSAIGLQKTRNTAQSCCY